MKKVSKIGLLISLCLSLSACGVFKPGEEQKQAQLQQQAMQQATAIEHYFEKYGILAKTYANNPMLVDWFSQHSERGKDLSNDVEYQKVNKTFKQISESNDDIFSAYFASKITGEYFREDEITGAQHDYYTYKRPWFMAAIAQGQKFQVGSPSSNPTANIYSSVIQAAIKNDKDELVGVAGVDVNLRPVLAQLASIPTLENGFAILLNDKGQVIFFPNNPITANFKITTATLDDYGEAVLDSQGNPLQGVTAVKLNHPLKDFDSHPQTEGFKQLTEALKQNSQGTATVTFVNQKYNAAYQGVQLSDPILSWYLVLLQPQ